MIREGGAEDRASLKSCSAASRGRQETNAAILQLFQRAGLSSLLTRGNNRRFRKKKAGQSLVVVFPAGAAAVPPCNFKNPQFTLVVAVVVVSSFRRCCHGDGAVGHGQKPHLSFFIRTVVERLNSDGKTPFSPSCSSFSTCGLLQWSKGEQIINVPRLRNKREQRD